MKSNCAEWILEISECEFDIQPTVGARKRGNEEVHSWKSSAPSPVPWHAPVWGSPVRRQRTATQYSTPSTALRSRAIRCTSIIIQEALICLFPSALGIAPGPAKGEIDEAKRLSDNRSRRGNGGPRARRRANGSRRLPHPAAPPPYAPTAMPGQETALRPRHPVRPPGIPPTSIRATSTGLGLIPRTRTGCADPDLSRDGSRFGGTE